MKTAPARRMDDASRPAFAEKCEEVTVDYAHQAMRDVHNGFTTLTGDIHHMCTARR